MNRKPPTTVSLTSLSLEEKRALARRALDRTGSARKDAFPKPAAFPDGMAPDDQRVGLGDLPGLEQLHRQQAELVRLGIANPYFHGHEDVSRQTVRIAGRNYLNFAGYNYLGLSGHPAVSNAAKAAIDQFGTSVSASRVASGEIPLHLELERSLSTFLGSEACVVFVSGYGTNVTVLGHLFGPRDLIVHDALIHNSALAGAMLSGARRLPFAHNDLAELDRLLAEHRADYERTIIIVEGVYSMDGDIPNLPRLIELKRRYKALLMVDEAHSIGVLGARGRGISEHFLGIASSDVDIWMGTLSKTLASCGGYIAGGREFVEYMKYTAPGFVYSVGLSPADTAAALAALRVLELEPERVTRLRARAASFLRRARERGLNTGASGGTAIVPVIVGDSLRTLRLSEALFRHGINVQPILYPAVPESQARLRFFITADHDEEQIARAVNCVADCLEGLSGNAAPASAGNSRFSATGR